MSPQAAPAQLVPLDEIAACVGTFPEVVASRLPARVKIHPDWQGRPSIPHDAAARLVDELEAERRKQADRSPNAAASLKPRPPPSTSRGAHVTINPSSSPGNSERPPTVGGSLPCLGWA